MAKLQGHYMKYRDNVDECALNAFEVTMELESSFQEMNVSEWLDRLALRKYYRYF
jgi:hypothetical protein